MSGLRNVCCPVYISSRFLAIHNKYSHGRQKTNYYRWMNAVDLLKETRD
uniref:Uncharacterized protein n=1 Tax=Nelumbo nucifera TaxID=4432 RepID=A0A822Z726_NELNU|nr:TPA_asm: hypothetical protein HUJ06_000414 [Nelumbo nucifera]